MARVDAMSFVDAWVKVYETGGSQADVAREIGTSGANVSTRAKKLREQGVNLPELKVTRTGTTIDIEALNERLAKRLAKA